MTKSIIDPNEPPATELKSEVYPLAIDRQLVIDMLVELGFPRETIMDMRRCEITPAGIELEHRRRAPGGPALIFGSSCIASATVRIPYRRDSHAAS